jgi:hypothetical protein
MTEFRQTTPNDRITIAAMNATPLLFNKSRAAKTSWLSLGYEDDTPNGAFNTVLCHLRIMPQIFGAPTRDDRPDSSCCLP